MVERTERGAMSHSLLIGANAEEPTWCRAYPMSWLGGEKSAEPVGTSIDMPKIGFAEVALPT